jgi:hypothetical protein
VIKNYGVLTRALGTLAACAGVLVVLVVSQDSGGHGYFLGGLLVLGGLLLRIEAAIRAVFDRLAERARDSDDQLIGA